MISILFILIILSEAWETLNYTGSVNIPNNLYKLVFNTEQGGNYHEIPKELSYSFNFSSNMIIYVYDWHPYDPEN